MKRILSLVITLTLVFMLFMFAAPKVAAETTSTCNTDNTVFVHYHRWDDTYTGTTIWTWGNGTDPDVPSNPASGEGTGVVDTDGFGAIYQICVNSADAGVNDDAEAGVFVGTPGAELGLILKYGDGWSGDDFTDRDSIDLNDDGNKDNKAIVIRDENGDLQGFNNGVKHVYVFEGSGQVIYPDDANSLPYSEDVATIAIIYFDVTQSYDGWNIWTWDTGTLGTQLGDDFYSGSGVPLVSSLGTDGGIAEDFRVAFINVDPADMLSEIGFIMRTDAWEKKNLDGENIMISTDGLVAGDFHTQFYIAGEGVMYDTFAAFEAQVNLFEIESAKALDRTSVEVKFNKDVITIVDEVDVFDPTAFSLEDKDGNAVVIESVSYNSTTDANKLFTLILETELAGSASPYTVTYDDGEFVLTIDFEVDSTVPVITIIGSQNVTLELGDTYSLPTYSASDMVGEEAVVVYNVKVKADHGTVDTRNAGIYEVVIVAEDAFGNITEETITVTVEDPCDETAHLDANSFNTELMALLIGLPLALGAIITLRREY